MTRQANSLRAYVGRQLKPAAPNDLYDTPLYYTRKLLELEEFAEPVLEPAAGRLAITRVLEEHGMRVVSSDLNYGGSRRDFFDVHEHYPSIITNPPYSRGAPEAFIQHSLEVADKVAMLLRLTFLEGQGRVEMFRTTPLKVVYVLTKRYFLSTGKPGGIMPYCWFVWDKADYRGFTRLAWVK